VETLSLGKIRLYEDKTNVFLSMLLCPAEMHKDHVWKPATQEHCVLSTDQKCFGLVSILLANALQEFAEKLNLWE